MHSFPRALRLPRSASARFRTDEGTAENAEHAEEIAGRGRTGSRSSDLTIVPGLAAPLLTQRITTGMDLIRGCLKKRPFGGQRKQLPAEGQTRVRPLFQIASRRAANEILPVVDEAASPGRRRFWTLLAWSTTVHFDRPVAWQQNS